MKLDVNLRVRRVWFVWITTIFAYPTILQYEKLVDLWPASPGSVFVGNMFTKTQQKNGVIDGYIELFNIKITF